MQQTRPKTSAISTITIRPIRGDDAELIRAAGDYTSASTYQLRFHGAKSGFSDSELAYLCKVDGVKHVAYIATDDAQSDRLAAVARYVCFGDAGEAEVAVTVHNPYQQQGLGRRLLTTLVAHARAHGVKRLVIIIQPTNIPMRDLLLDVCPQTYIQRRDGDIHYAVDLA